MIYNDERLYFLPMPVKFFFLKIADYERKIQNVKSFKS